jgi:hypothetical protein
MKKTLPPGLVARLAAMGLLAISGYAVAQPKASLAHCIPEPALFDWQALDDGNIVVWPAMDPGFYEIALSHHIDGLTTTDPVSLKFVDGDHDGYICSEGMDSVTLWSSGEDSQGDVPVPIGTAEVYILDPLDDLALTERLSSYAATRGPRVRTGNAD